MKSQIPHPDLLVAQKFLYQPNKLLLSNLIHEKESKEYGACSFILNNKKVLFRVAKITPTKSGQFVTLWKRSAEGIIAPFDENDIFDFVIVSVRKNEQLGQFIFPKNVLVQQGVFSSNKRGGKRALRVYPEWDEPTNQQALKSQMWQLRYFVAIKQDCSIYTKIKQIIL